MRSGGGLVHRFFVGFSLLGANEVTIEGDDSAHIARVLRLSDGDEITVCDSDGFDSVCSLTYVSPSKAVAQILSRTQSLNEPQIKVSIFQGVPKGDKLDTVVQKCTELGAVKIVPFDAKRSVAKIKDAEKKRERMQKIAYEASKQSKRAFIPEILPVMSFKDAIENAKNADICIIAYEEEKSQSIKEVLMKNKSAKTVSIFIGPEGGFSPEEIEFAKSNGFQSVLMGPRILRTETAPLAALTAVMYELGDW